MRRAEVREGQRVLVSGAGPIGMAAMLFARLRGAVVTALDPRADRLQQCARALGVTQLVPLAPEDEGALAALTQGEFFDTVFDATGNPQAMARGFRFVAHGGRYVLISVVSADITFNDPEFHKRETTLLGSRNATPEDFETVLAAMRAGQVPVAALNTHRMTLAEVPERFASLLDPAQGVVKALVDV